MKNVILFSALLLSLFSCKEKEAQTKIDEEQTSGINLSHIDSTAFPGDNFFRYANGEWLKTANMYPGMPMNGNMVELTFKTQDQVGEIMAEVLKEGDFPKNSPKGQIQAFYKSYMDTITRNELGMKPLQPELDTIFAAKTRSDLSRIMAQPLMPHMWGGYVFLDAKNTKRYVPIISQPDLGIGEIEYYLNDTDRNLDIRKKYVDLIGAFFTYAGIDNPQKRAEAILRLETKMANVFWTGTQKRDPDKMYHLMTTEELKAYAPGIDWQAYWDANGKGSYSELVVQTDTAIKGVSKIFGESSLDDLKSLMAFYLIKTNATFLSTEINDVYFDFAGKTMMGVVEQQSLEDKAKGILNKFLSWQLGELYADKYYTTEVEDTIEMLVGYMKQAIVKRLESNVWMDEETKKEAVAKFNNIHWKVGRPDKIIDLSSLEFEEDDLIGNFRKIAKSELEDQISRLTEAKREWEWLMPPQMVNAYYQSEMNDVVIPVGILQSPNFDPTADPASNFGGVLSVVGHEVGHGFDDKGSKSDAEGLLRNWWTVASREEFENRATELANQYDQYETIPGVYLNGRLTLGENIGDVGGLAIALEAYHNYVNDHQNGEAPVIDGLTGDQRFFIANAQLWSWIMTDDYARMMAVSDNHSPGKFRVNGVVRNMDAWYEAFDIKPGDSLYLAPDSRVKIW